MAHKTPLAAALHFQAAQCVSSTQKHVDHNSKARMQRIKSKDKTPLLVSTLRLNRGHGRNMRALLSALIPDSGTATTSDSTV
jgi:hypothetical protein